MGLERIRHAVLSKAKAEATVIVESARERNSEFLKSQKEVAQNEFDRLCRLRMQGIEEEYNRKLIQLKGSANKQILDKRNTFLKSLFERAAQEILTRDRDRYAEIMGRLIGKASGGYEGRIRIHPAEKDLFERVLSQAKEVRGDSKITLDESDWLPKPGGFIFVSVDFEVDQTLETALKEVEHDMLPAIAADLFAGR